jgi:excinuclease ABC subunit B
MDKFKVVSPFAPAGDQGQAIEALAEGVIKGFKNQSLKGVTGSGKTYTMAKIIESVQLPTLVISHNKTLAAQLYREFRDFFPENAVEYFVSYYDYYQPEAYVPARDLYIEKDASINDEIDRLRLSATQALMERKDVIIVATVSCIYGLGNPSSYRDMRLVVEKGEEADRDAILKTLISLQYERNNMILERGKFRLKGDILEILPAYMKDAAYRLCFDWDRVEKIERFDPLTGNVLEQINKCTVYPAKHFVMPEDRIRAALENIREELNGRYAELTDRGKMVEAQRIKTRTEYDLEMLNEMGFCPGIENYSRHLSGRSAGERPEVLIDYYPEEFLTFVDESHVTLPQLRAMYEGDRSRKSNLVDFGFRLPSALDNRPLYYEEFESIIDRRIFVSATPGDEEAEKSKQFVEQIIRPTGLLDPDIDVRPTKGQIDNLYAEIRKRIAEGERVLVTTLTKRMAEDLTDYFCNLGVKARYIHSEIETIERVEIIRDLRKGDFDVLVGINLLREGLDMPEVSLIAIMDADKIGFLRSERSLIQIIGRAARNVNGLVIMYADNVSDAMAKAISETERRRALQARYNEEHGITPQTIKKEIQDILVRRTREKQDAEKLSIDIMKQNTNLLNPDQKKKLIRALEKEMLERAKNLEFEQAAVIRDEIMKLKGEKT